MFADLKALMVKPALDEKGTLALWTDEHISKGMLEAHLHPTWDAATRNHALVRENAAWIGSVAKAETYRDLLDLGCGPGIYAEEFHKLGYRTAGLDISERSIQYARNSAAEKNLPITYYCQNFLEMDFREQFDVITMIYYDICSFPANDRAKVLENACAALRPGGLLLVEIHTPEQFSGKKEHTAWTYSDSGFYCARPHLCLESFYRYDEDNTILYQYIIMTEQDVKHINIWHHMPTEAEFSQALGAAGFHIKALYGSMTGAEYRDDGKEICFVAQKKA